MRLESVAQLLPGLKELQTELVLLSGGEPLLNPDWETIARLLRANGHKVWLLTSGLSLAKHARKAAGLFDSITVSLDGTNCQTYREIRGLDAFDKVCEGIRSVVACGASPNIRVTLQRANYLQLRSFVDLAIELGAGQISFLAVDVANPHAFGRTDGFAADLALRPEDLPVFERLLRSLEETHRADFRSGFIAENPQKLRRILQYFAALNGAGTFPTVRCNAPEFSAVIGATGRVQPCFFISGPSDAHGDFQSALNRESSIRLRADIRSGGRTECNTCVCSMWREPRAQS
jgi:Fe-coproporphyrin III synthase